MAKFYRVGGCVRDELMSRICNDIDYSVEAQSYDDMRQAILQRGGEIFLETPEYFTIRANVPNMGACDFVLCRKDGQYFDGRRPESVKRGSIFDDLARRDFTMNAIAKDEDDTWYDPYDGMRSIKAKMIRCVGNVEDRFNEDGLRMLRALRFCVVLNFRLSHDIIVFLLKGDNAKLLHGVSIERIRDEMYKMFKHDSLRSLDILRKFCSQELQEAILGRELWLMPTLKGR